MSEQDKKTIGDALYMPRADEIEFEAPRLGSSGAAATEFEIDRLRQQLSEARGKIEELESATKWELADVVEEGEYLFVYAPGGDYKDAAKYGVGVKAWQDPSNPKDYVVANWNWAMNPTHAMKLPKPPNGVTYDEFMAPSRAQLSAALWKRAEDDLAAKDERIASLEAALKPFAEEFRMERDEDPELDARDDDDRIPIGLRLGDLRTASQVLKGTDNA